jgi:hypothetical protein
VIDAEAMAELRAVATGIIADEIKTTAVVYRRTRSTENAYGTSGETYEDPVTHTGWLVEKRATPIGGDNGLQSGLNVFEFRFDDVDAVVAPGDELLIDEQRYTVQDTNGEVTLKVFLKATLARVQ